MYTHVRPSEGPLSHTLGVVGAKRSEGITWWFVSWSAQQKALSSHLLCLQEQSATRAWNSNRKHTLA